MKNSKELFLDEEYFPYENMSIEERNFIMMLLYNTKELEDNSDMRIIQCIFKKLENGMYKANGMIAAKISENRAFDAYINLEKNNVSIKSNIVKLLSADRNKEFIEYTNFKKINNTTYKRQTKYSYSNICYEKDVDITDLSKKTGTKIR